MTKSQLKHSGDHSTAVLQPLRVRATLVLSIALVSAPSSGCLLPEGKLARSEQSGATTGASALDAPQEPNKTGDASRPRASTPDQPTTAGDSADRDPEPIDDADKDEVVEPPGAVSKSRRAATKTFRTTTPTRWQRTR